MRLPLETYKLRLAPQILQRGEELLPLTDRAAQVLVAVQDQERRVDVLDVGQRREVARAFGVAPGNDADLVLKPPADVARPEERRDVGNTAHRHGRLEAVAVAYGPVGHEAAIAAPCDTQPRAVESRAQPTARERR